MLSENKNKWLDNSTKIRKGEELDVEKLQAYLQKHLPQNKSHEQLIIEQFPKGYSNLTYLLKMGDNDLVLRRPPYGANIKSAHDMSREFHILSNLTKIYDKTPKALLFCEDKSIIGADFYVMQRIKGVILRPKMPSDMIPNAETMAGIAQASVKTLAELHALDYKSTDLKDLGRPEGYVKRQIEGWTRRYFRAKTDEIGMIEQTAKWLANNMPKETATSVIHNDYKYDTLVLDTNDWTKVIGILDWEMATIGDPLMDVGTSLGYWIDADDHPKVKALQFSPTTSAGNPNRAEFAEMYANKSGRNLDDILFYYVYGLFKIAVIIQQIYARYKKGHTKDTRFAQLIHGVSACGLMATQAINKKRIDRLFA